jgi:hypothetical protein
MDKRSHVGVVLGMVVSVLAVASPAAAQAPPDTWQVTIAPYLMGASMNGTTTVRGIDMQTDLSASDIFSNLEFGAMGFAAARKGKWGFGGDAIWMALGTSLTRLPGSVDVNQGAFAFYGLNVTWVDPLVGLTLRTPGDRRVGFKVYTEIGGFGAGSDFTWQIFPTVSIKFNDHAFMDIGYRWLDMDYKTGDGSTQFGYNVLTQGPVLGFSFKF